MSAIRLAMILTTNDTRIPSMLFHLPPPVVGFEVTTAKTVYHRVQQESIKLCEAVDFHGPRYGFDVQREHGACFAVEVAFERVPARHGTSQAVLDDMGPGTGVVFMAAGEPTIYWAGDTVWYKEVEKAIRTFQPEVIVVHAGSAMWAGEPIIMNAEDVIAVCKAAPNAKVIAVHMECCDHCIVSRAELRAKAEAAGISEEQLLIPADGEEIAIQQEAAF